MPIRKFVLGATFDPETIKVMVSAFEGARTILNLDNPNDPLIEIVAKKVIGLVSQGISDPEEIKRRVIADALQDIGHHEQKADELRIDSTRAVYLTDK